MTVNRTLNRSSLVPCWRCCWLRADTRRHAPFTAVRQLTSQRPRPRAAERGSPTTSSSQGSSNRQTAAASVTASQSIKPTTSLNSLASASLTPASPLLRTSPAQLSSSVLSWGSGAFGGLGCSSYRPHISPTLVPALSALPSAVTSVSSGWTHNLAITASGGLYMWGYKPFLRSLSFTAKLHNRFPSLLASLQSLNLGRLTLSNADTTPTAAPHFGHSLHAVSASCGGDYAAIVTSDQRLFTVGSGFFGQLGRSSAVTDTITLQPREVERLTAEGVRVKAVSCGFHHMLVLADDGTVYVCGKHDHGALGIGRVVKEGKRLFYPHLVPHTSHSPTALLSLDPNDERRTVSSLPTPPAYIGEVVQVSAGMKHSLLLTRDGRVYAAGHNQFGQCGFTPLDITSLPASATTTPTASTASSASSFLSLSSFTRISALRHERIVYVSAGQHHSLFVTVDGRVLACGLNQQGQCGPASPLASTQRQSSSASSYTARSFLCVSTPHSLLLPVDFHCVRAVAGFYDTALLGRDGRLFWCGGRMRQQQNEGSSQGSLGAVVELMAGQRVLDVSFGLVHSLLLTEHSDIAGRSSAHQPFDTTTPRVACERSTSRPSHDSSVRPGWY